jgi:hypothetical protein
LNAPIGGGAGIGGAIDAGTCIGGGGIDAGTGMGAIDESNGGGANGGGANGGGADGDANGANGANGGGADGDIDDGANGGGADGDIDDGIGSGIEAGIGSGDDDDDARIEAAPTTAIGAGVRSGFSDAVVDSGLRSRGSAIGSVEGLLGDALGATDGDEALGADGATDADTMVRGATDAETAVRGATDGGAGGAIEGARGAIGAWLARGGIDAWLARGGIDAGRAAETGASPEASLIRRVPGATLTGGAFSTTVLTGGCSRPFVSSASASAMSGGSPCAVAASS